METLSIVLSFAAGVLLILTCALVFSWKSRGVVKLIINAAIGIIVLICLNMFNIVYLPLNPLTAVIAGFFGVPGIIVIYIITVFL